MAWQAAHHVRAAGQLIPAPYGCDTGDLAHGLRQPRVIEYLEDARSAENAMALLRCSQADDAAAGNSRGDAVLMCCLSSNGVVSNMYAYYLCTQTSGKPGVVHA